MISPLRIDGFIIGGFLDSRQWAVFHQLETSGMKRVWPLGTFSYGTS